MTRKEAISKLNELIECTVDREMIDDICYEVIEFLEAQEPRVHGRWIEESDRTNHWHCSNCGFVEGIVSRFYNYCPNCGARMGVCEE